MTINEIIQYLLAMLALVLPWDHWFFQLLEDSAKHFSLAFSAGLLVFSLTSIILFVFYWVTLRLSRGQASMAAVCFILFICTLLSLSAALASHWGLDYLAYLYTLPLDGIGDLDLVMP